MQNRGGQNNLPSADTPRQREEEEDDDEEAISTTEDFARVRLKARGAPLATNAFARFAYRSVLISRAEREIKPAQNVVSNPFKCGRGGGGL